MHRECLEVFAGHLRLPMNRNAAQPCQRDTVTGRLTRFGSGSEAEATVRH